MTLKQEYNIVRLVACIMRIYKEGKHKKIINKIKIKILIELLMIYVRNDQSKIQYAVNRYYQKRNLVV